MGDISLFSLGGIDYLTRWGHFFFGITWIGLLYYFNFVQTEYFKEATPDARTDVFVKLAPKALWWFRWGAMFTFLTGLVLLGIRGAGTTLDIALGAIMGTLMFLNVWIIIWPKQKILIQSNQAIANGGSPLPAAAAAAPKAALASRTNTLFSLPMLFFMGSSAHLPHGHLMNTADTAVALIVALIVIALIEANAIFGKMGPMASVRGVLSCSLGLTLALYLIVALL